MIFPDRVLPNVCRSAAATRERLKMTSKIDRRDFLKLGVAATATAAIGIGMSDAGLIPLPMAAPQASAAY